MPQLQTVGMKESSFCLASWILYIYYKYPELSLFEMKRCGRGEMCEDEEQP